MAIRICGGFNKMKRFLTLLTILLVAVAATGRMEAQLLQSTNKVGTTAAQFLKIGAGSRAIGMGGAYAAVGTDLYSVYWNPAGIATNPNSTQFTFNHAEWLADMKYDFAAASFRMEGMGVFTASVTSFSVPEEKVRTFENPEGDGRTWDASSLAIGVGFARALTDRFSVGMNVKYVSESVWNSTATGFAFDVGTLYRTPFNDLMIGASISNFGSTMSLDGRDVQFNTDPNNNLDSGPNNVPALYETDEFDLPLTFRIGLAMDVIKTRFIRITTAVDAAHPNDNTEYVNSGLELAYDETFMVRVGYKSLFKEDSEEGLTFGAGLNYNIAGNFKVQINYGYADFGRLEDVQFFDIGLVF